MSPYVIAAVVVVALAASFWVQRRRRQQAERTAAQLGGTLAVDAGPAPPASGGGIGTPNPAVPAPAVAPDQLRSVATSAPPVRLTICGLPALAWQRVHDETSYSGMRLALIVDAGVGFPVLNLFHRAGFLQRFAGDHGPADLGALDDRFRIAGELDRWQPVLSRPDVQQALLTFPLDTVSVLGSRLTFVSMDGVHLTPEATRGLAEVAATVIAAVPSGLAAPATRAGDMPTDVDAVVAQALTRSGISPEQQQALLALVRAQH